jgi:glucose 1-dehydrogenase
MTGTRLLARVALVTGAASGNGRAIALRFAEEGADLALVDLNQAGLEETATTVRARGRRALVLVADVSRADAVAAAVASAAGELGRLDIVVNNAGILRGTALIDQDPAEWDQVIAVNLKGVFLGMQAAARQMVAQGGGGVIVNMSSSASVYPVPTKAAYCASKGGVSALTRAAAWELGPHDIRVNAIAPGGIRTPMTERAQRDPSLPEWEARIPAGRMGEPADVADVAVFLAGDESRYITGQTIHVDGGSTLPNGRTGVYGTIRRLPVTP